MTKRRQLNTARQRSCKQRLKFQRVAKLATSSMVAGLNIQSPCRSLHCSDFILQLLTADLLTVLIEDILPSAVESRTFYSVIAESQPWGLQALTFTCDILLDTRHQFVGPLYQTVIILTSDRTNGLPLTSNPAQY